MDLNIVTKDDLKAIETRLSNIEKLLCGKMSVKSEWLTTKQMRENFGICYNTLQMWVQSGKTQKKNIGGRCYYKNIEL